jgi:predicted RNase H-like HicB family nuclease
MVKLVSKQLNNGEDVIEMYLEAWQVDGESIPKPKILQAA